MKNGHYIKRLKPDPTSRVTQGRIYEVNNGFILDDDGIELKPAMKLFHDGYYWETCKAPQGHEPYEAQKAPQLQYVMRTGGTTGKVSRGSIYKYTDGRIKDDRGEDFEPDTSNEHFWQFCDERGYGVPEPKKIKLLPKRKKEKVTKMLSIKKTTLINGDEASEFSVDTLISYIKSEEKKIADLDEVKSTSKAIAKIKAQHEANIAGLLEILDSKES